MRDRKRNNDLIALANKVLIDTSYLFISAKSQDIPDAYNGQVAAFGVSVAMLGLKPTVAIYYQDGDTKVNRKTILAVLYEMLERLPNPDIQKEYSEEKNGAKELLRKVIEDEYSQKDIVDCSIALKQVIRTFNLVKQ